MSMNRAAEVSFDDVSFPPQVTPFMDKEKDKKKKKHNAIRKFCW